MAREERFSATPASGEGPFAEAVRRVQARSRREGRQVLGASRGAGRVLSAILTHNRWSQHKREGLFAGGCVPLQQASELTRRYPNYCM